MEGIRLERDTRLAFLDEAEQFTPLIAADSGGSRFLLSTYDRHITSHLVLKPGRSETKMLRRALSVLGTLGREITGGTLIDVGANIGTTTVPALRGHPFVRVVACEPEPRNLRLLNLNLVANRLEKDVHVEDAAVGECETEVEFLVSDRRSGIHEVRSAGAGLPAWTEDFSYESMTVRQTTLDALARRGVYTPADVSLLWMDVEGHEGHILEGGSALTERGTPVVLELSPRGLARHGGLERLKEIASSRYSHFVSLRQVHGRHLRQFDLRTSGELAQELDWLLRNERFTDVLLLRDPLAVPRRPAVGRTDRPGRRPREKRRTKLPVSERAARSPRPEDCEAFLGRARPLTPLLAAELDGSTFIVRTDEDAEELPLFLQRSHPRLRLLAAAMAVLEELRLDGKARRGAYLELGSGVGLSAVAAVHSHGFSAAVACEPDLSAYDVLRLNIASNDLNDRIRAVPVHPLDVPVDALLERGVVPAQVGLVAIMVPQVREILDGLGALLDRTPPLMLGLAGPPSAPDVAEILGRAGYSRFARIASASGGDSPGGPQPIPELSRLSGDVSVLIWTERERFNPDDDQDGPVQ